jgi:predicted kinase
MNLSPELIIFVGVQAAGKSSYYGAHFSTTHVHVSKDLLKNARDREARQRLMIAQALTEGRPVVVDNTNQTPVVRAPLIELGRQYRARVLAYFFETAVMDAIARNRLREGRARVPDAVIYVAARRVVLPSTAEGFDEVRIVQALPPLPEVP